MATPSPLSPRHGGFRLAHLFDPLLAVHLSRVEPLPHQIRAVYGEMLPRQPLRFVLADDPGAGKTIMAGLYIKELLLRSDVGALPSGRPGWAGHPVAGRAGGEVRTLEFEILGRDAIEASRSGNPFGERDLVIARMDHLSRNDDVQARLQATEWDLVRGGRSAPHVGPLRGRRRARDPPLPAGAPSRLDDPSLSAVDRHAPLPARTKTSGCSWPWSTPTVSRGGDGAPEERSTPPGS